MFNMSKRELFGWKIGGLFEGMYVEINVRKIKKIIIAWIKNNYLKKIGLFDS